MKSKVNDVFDIAKNILNNFENILEIFWKKIFLARRRRGRPTGAWPYTLHHAYFLLPKSYGGGRDILPPPLYVRIVENFNKVIYAKKYQ